MTDIKEPSKLGKTQRQHLVARLIESQVIANQQALVDHLAAEGVVATQATVSRDLEDLGANLSPYPFGIAGQPVRIRYARLHDFQRRPVEQMR